jgi:hypothetical protein
MKRLIPASLLLIVIATAPLLAEEPTEVEKLRATVEQLQKTVQDLQQRITELEKQGAGQKAPAEAAPAAATEKTLVPDYNTVSDQQPAAPRADNVPLDPELKGFVPIPGTGSMFKIGGSARVDAIYDTGNNGNPNWFNPSSMPVEGQPGAEGGERSALHGKGTRMSLELRRNLGTKDKLRIFYENDFFGDSSSSTMTYRLRHLYGQAANFLVGQTYSGFENIDSWPDVVDNLGPNGIVNRRQAQIRYTHPVSRGEHDRQSVYFSVEMPSTEIDTELEPFPAGARTVNRLPDLVAGYRLERKAGHLQLAALGRSLTVEQSSGARDSVTGWGLNLSGAINVLEGDRISYQVVYGEGVARYLNDTNGLDLDAGVGADGSLEAIPILAPVIGYAHKWNDTWRSTVTYSFVRVDAPASSGPDVIDENEFASVNLIYQPTKAFRLGLEYLHGTKETADGSKGDADRIDFVVKYDLVK